MDKETQTIFSFTSELKKKNYIGEPVPAVPLPTQESKEISSKFNCNLSIEEISLLKMLLNYLMILMNFIL